MVIDSSPKIKDRKYQKVVNGGKKGQKGEKWPRDIKVGVVKFYSSSDWILTTFYLVGIFDHF